MVRKVIVLVFLLAAAGSVTVVLWSCSVTKHHRPAAMKRYDLQRRGWGVLWLYITNGALVLYNNERKIGKAQCQQTLVNQLYRQLYGQQFPGPSGYPAPPGAPIPYHGGVLGIQSYRGEFAGIGFCISADVVRSSWEASFCLPLCVLTMLFAAYPSIAFIRGPARRWRRRRKGLWARCGYNLTGNVSGVSRVWRGVAGDDRHEEPYGAR